MKLGYIIYYVKNVSKTLQFYEKAFLMKTRFLHESKEYGELDTGATTLAFASYNMLKANLQKTKPPVDRHGSEIAFVTKNVNKAYEHAIMNGAKAIKAPTQKPWGQIVAYLSDPEGNLIELCTPVS